MRHPHRNRRSAVVTAALLALLVAACGDSPSDGGNAVASVTITPDNPSIVVGATVQLNAAVRNASGAAVTGASVTWRSDNEAVATVNTTGRVAGISAGTARVIATSGSRADTVVVTVTVPSPVTVTAVAPATLQPGATATITGTGFSTVPAENTVTIAGVAAQVTSATTTSLTVTVPAAVCAPPGNVTVRVTVAGMTGDRTHAWEGTQPLVVPLGQQVRLGVAGTYCLNLSGVGGAAYLVGVQSVTGVATSLTPTVVRGVAAASASPVADAQRFTLPEPAAGVRPAQTRSQERLARHRAAELEFRRQERQFLQTRRPGSVRRQVTAAQANAAQAAGVAIDAAVPANAAVGDTVNLKYPRTPFCTNFTAVRGVVRNVGTRGIWVEDVTNPAGGFSAAQYAELSAQFDGAIYATNAAYFGEPTDFDNNQRIVILLTRQVNQDGVLGRVYSVDFFPEQCPASNGGEIFYGIAPDPDSIAGSIRITAAEALEDMPTIIAHELAHVIQFGRRLTTPGASEWQTLWELEGQATFAEEVVGHAITGRQPRQNYPFEVGWGANGSVEAQWYRQLFFDLVLYFGANPLTNPVSTIPGAPEQCGWLGRPEGDNMGPCIGNRNLYGVSWSFLRWISDHYGPQYPGGEQGLHRAMIQATDTGFVTMARLTGQPHDVLLARWAAALYVDDRVQAEPLLTLPSWSLFNIFNRLIEPARLRPYERTLSNFSDQVQVRAGSTAYYRVSATGQGTIAVEGPGGGALPAHMRVWVVRLQ